MTNAEARQLLCIEARGSLDKASVETAYHAQMRQWSARLNNALTRKQREAAVDVIDFINEAKRVLLSPGGRPTVVSTPAMSKRRWGQRSQSVSHCVVALHSVRAFFAAIRRGVESLVEAARCTVRVGRGVWDAMHMARVELGLPQPVIFLVIVIVLLVGFNGCVNAVQAISQLGK